MEHRKIRKTGLVLLAATLLCSTVPSFAAKSSLNVLTAVRDDYVADFGTSLKGAKVDAVDDYGASALAWAVIRNQPLVIQQLLDAHANPNLLDVNHVGPLFLAVINNQPAMVAALLAKGADPNAAKIDGDTPLMMAVRAGSADMARMLLDKGADPNARESKFGQTALMWAAGNPQIVRMLLDKKADFRVAAKSWEVSSVFYTPSITTLGSTGIPWTNAGEYTTMTGGETALIAAVREGDLDSAKMLVEAGADVNQAAADGTTPLLASLYNWRPGNGGGGGNRARNGARANRPANGATPAANATAQPAAANAVALAANVNGQPIAANAAAPANNNANQAVRRRPATGGPAVYMPDFNVANYLLDHGAKVNVADGSGFTPLHGAILAAQTQAGGFGGGGRSGSGAKIPRPPAGEAKALPVIRRLLEAGADPNRATLWPTAGPVGDVRVSPAFPGSTPMHLAVQVNSSAIADLLGQFKGDPNKVRWDGHSPLSLAAKTDDLAVMNVLVKYGADFTKTYNPNDEIPDPLVVKTQQYQQQTLIHIAATAGAADVIPYLISKGVPMDAKNAQGKTALDLADEQEVFRYKADYEGGVGVVDAKAVRETRTTDALKAAGAKKAMPYLAGDQLKPSSGA